MCVREKCGGFEQPWTRPAWCSIPSAPGISRASPTVPCGPWFQCCPTPRQRASHARQTAFPALGFDRMLPGSRLPLPAGPGWCFPAPAKQSSAPCASLAPSVCCRPQARGRCAKCHH
uniref:Uncharacterized protein n=1 Tax=uncultured bacterium TB313_p TaxID=1552142 RepID=A0A0K0LBL7_9BACT|nr:hypothetical protein [uncultured bacterium TB313_p]